MGVRPASLASALSSLSRARPATGRLSLGALGLALVLLVSGAWGTGVFYLMARLGAASPVRLASIDGLHVYVGLVGGVFVLAKVARVGLRYRVDGVPGVVPWQRWMSWSLLTLYGAVFLTGVLVLLPIPGRLRIDLVEMHLLTSAWALVPTTWHVWHYRARALPHLKRWGASATWRFWLGAALVALPAPALLASGQAVSLLPQVMGGSAWVAAPLGGAYLDAVTVTESGALVAAGDALYVSHDGVVWVRVDVPAAPPSAPSGPSASPSGGDSHAGHEHGPPAPANAIAALAVTGDRVLAGTPQGLYASPGLDGPLEPVGPSPGAVRSLAVDPADPGSIWMASASGPEFSSDGGRTWARLAAGLERPAGAAAVAYLGQQAFASDSTGVFRWEAGGRSWVRVSRQASVTRLTAGDDGRLYASSLTDGVQALSGGRWTRLSDPAPVHNHHGQVHGQTPDITTLEGRLYAAGTSDGVAASADGGGSWTQLGGGLGGATPSQVAPFHGSLWAATGSGLYRFGLTPAPPASWEWWLAVLAAAAGVGLAATAVGALRPRR